MEKLFPKPLIYLWSTLYEFVLLKSFLNDPHLLYRQYAHISLPFKNPKNTELSQYTVSCNQNGVQ